MSPKHIKLLIAVLAALGIGGGTLLTGGGSRAPSDARAPQLDGEKLAKLDGARTGGDARPARAVVDCRSLKHWTRVGNGPRINQTHVFCGEWDKRRSRAKGFHSRPGGRNPVTVARLEVSQQSNGAGIYGVRWMYSGASGADKFSTMFPDHCTRESVLASIDHASRHQQRCPDSAPHWAWCGPSAPLGGSGAGFCAGSNGTGFTIAGGLLDDGSVNTAFPLR